jgi:hypothetical protein
MTSNKNDLDDPRKLMGVLIRMELNPHEEIKIGKKAAKKCALGRTQKDRRDSFYAATLSRAMIA